MNKLQSYEQLFLVYNYFMDNYSRSRSIKPIIEPTNPISNIKPTENISSTNALNGKSHSSSTSNTPRKQLQNKDQEFNFMKLPQYPKTKPEVKQQSHWETQYLKGLTPKKPIDGENYQQDQKLKEQENLFQNFSSYECLDERVDERKNKNHGCEKINQYGVQLNPFKQKDLQIMSSGVQSKIQLNLPQSSIYTSLSHELKNDDNRKNPLSNNENQKQKQHKSSSSTSENIFKIPDNTNEPPPEEQRVSKNIFQFPKRGSEIRNSQGEIFKFPTLNPNKKDSYLQNSDDDSDLYEFKIKNKSNLKKTVYKTNKGYNMQILEQILEASGLYEKDYLNQLDERTRSISVYEADFGNMSKLPQEFFFKPEERIIFRKIKSDIPHQYNFNANNILCKVNQKRTRFFHQDLKQDQLQNLKGMKCREISFPQSLKISRNVEYDSEKKRFFIFSNYQQSIYVFSQVTQDLICTFKVKKKVQDPHLYLHQIGNRLFLLLIGGYTKIQAKIVQGSKFLQIFQIRKWEVQLKSQLVKLVIGRISPLVMPITQHNETKILIMGGNSIAKIDKHEKLDYLYEKEINESTNLTGVSLRSQEIIQLFDYSCETPALLTSHPINILNPLSLHDGCLIPIKNTFYMLLPESKYLIQMKMFKREIHLIEGNKYEYIPQMSVIQRRQLCLNNKLESGVQIYRITEDGLFSIINRQTEAKNNCCLIY